MFVLAPLGGGGGGDDGGCCCCCCYYGVGLWGSMPGFLSLVV